MRSRPPHRFDGTPDANERAIEEGFMSSASEPGTSIDVFSSEGGSIRSSRRRARGRWPSTLGNPKSCSRRVPGCESSQYGRTSSSHNDSRAVDKTSCFDAGSTRLRLSRRGSKIKAGPSEKTRRSTQGDVRFVMGPIMGPIHRSNPRSGIALVARRYFMHCRGPSSAGVQPPLEELRELGVDVSSVRQEQRDPGQARNSRRARSALNP